MHALFLLVAAILAGSSIAFARDDIGDVRERISRLPLLFVENQGQLDRRVAYYLSGTDRTVYFTPSGVTLVMHGTGRQSPVKITFPGARPGVRPEASRPMPATSCGNSPAPAVPTPRILPTLPFAIAKVRESNQTTEPALDRLGGDSQLALRRST